jgi:hypothetical protein
MFLTVKYDLRFLWISLLYQHPFMHLLVPRNKSLVLVLLSLIFVECRSIIYPLLHHNTISSRKTTTHWITCHLWVSTVGDQVSSLLFGQRRIHRARNHFRLLHSIEFTVDVLFDLDYLLNNRPLILIELSFLVIYYFCRLLILLSSWR